MFELYFVTWENDFKRFINAFDNYDEADNARLTLESRYGTDEGYFLVVEV